MLSLLRRQPPSSQDGYVTLEMMWCSEFQLLGRAGSRIASLCRVTYCQLDLASSCRALQKYPRNWPPPPFCPRASSAGSGVREPKHPSTIYFGCEPDNLVTRCHTAVAFGTLALHPHGHFRPAPWQATLCHATVTVSDGLHHANVAPRQSSISHSPGYRMRHLSPILIAAMIGPYSGANTRLILVQAADLWASTTIILPPHTQGNYAVRLHPSR